MVNEPAIPPTVLLIELSVSGHRLGYLRWCTQAFQSRQYKVIVGTVTAVARDTRFKAWLADTDVVVDEITPPPIHVTALLPRTVRNFLLSKRIYESVAEKRRDISLVFLPYLDYVSHLTAICGSPFGSTAFGGILLRPYFHLKKPDSIFERVKLDLQRSLFERLLRNRSLMIACTNDELLHEEYTNRGIQDLCYLPDPAFLSKRSGNTQLPCPRDHRLTILVYGSIDAKKGLAQLIRAFAEHELAASYRVISAGRHSVDAANEIRSLRKSYDLAEDDVTVIDRYISDAEEADLFDIADLVWVGYPDFYNLSGVLAKAGLAGKPVVSANYGLNCYLVNKYQLGVHTDIHNPESVASELRRLADAESLRDGYGRNGRSKFSGHSAENFINRLRSHEYFG